MHDDATDTGLDSAGLPEEYATGEPMANPSSMDMMKRFQENKVSPVERGTEIGRYLVLREIGRGGMGVVYEADDPELGRSVALKLLWAPPLGIRTEVSTRLKSEARTLARLSDPNVVTIYDIGTHEEKLWIAMEHIEGPTLRKWAAVKARTWKEILFVLNDVARGVFAAHREGVVHRDLKPENVMVDGRDRARVMDFGIALTLSERAIDVLMGTSRQAPEASILARSATTPGTPAYMAPEQWKGEAITDLTDQFSWCVMAWELLFGERPFAGSSMEEVRDSVLEGQIDWSSDTARAPRWLRRILVRGMAVDPKMRYVSMGELLAEIEAAPKRRRARIGLGVVLVALSGVGIYEGGRHVKRRLVTTACATESATIETVWNPGDADVLRTRLGATGSPLVATTVDRIVPLLNDYTDQWHEAQMMACERASATDDWQATSRSKAQACLDERREYLAQALVLLHNPPVGTEGLGAVTHAITMINELPMIKTCMDVGHHESIPEPDPNVDADVIREVRMSLVRAAVLQTNGRFDEGLQFANKAREKVDSLDWTPLRVEMLYRRGTLLVAKGDYELAETELESAFFLGIGISQDETAIDAAIMLALVTGNHRGRAAEGIRWGKMAVALLEHGAIPDASARWAKAMRSLGTAYEDSGEVERAITHYQRALSRIEQISGRSHPLTLPYILDLANIRYRSGDYDQVRELLDRGQKIVEASLGSRHPQRATFLMLEANIVRAEGSYREAIRIHERACRILENALGSSHPDMGTCFTNIGLNYEHLGDYYQAVKYLKEALKVRELALGRRHPKYARALSNLGNAYDNVGEFEKAIDLNARAVKILEEVLDAGHPDLTVPLHALAHIHHGQGRLLQAQEYYERGIEILEKAYGPSHPNIAVFLTNLSGVYYGLNLRERALESLQRALAIKERALGSTNPELASTLTYIGVVHNGMGRHELARPVLERSLGLLSHNSTKPFDVAEASHALAVALWNGTKERARAIDLAKRARSEYHNAGSVYVAKVEEVEMWLRDREDEG